MPKAQLVVSYRQIPATLRRVRVAAGLSQRDLAVRLRKPQSFVHNCEVANRRVDVAEFVLWCRACEADALDAFAEVAARMK